MYSKTGTALEAMLMGYLSTCDDTQALEAVDILKKVISSIENGNQSKNGKRKYTRKSSIVLAKIKDFVQANPDATYPQIEAACGLGKNVIASSKTEVLEGMTLSDYVNICRVDPELLNKRKTNSF